MQIVFFFWNHQPDIRTPPLGKFLDIWTVAKKLHTFVIILKLSSLHNEQSMYLRLFLQDVSDW